MAFTLARARPVALLRLLLPGGFCHRTGCRSAAELKVTSIGRRLFAVFEDKRLPVTRSHCRNPSPMRWTIWAMAAFLLADSAHAATETTIRSIDIAHDSDAYVANVVMFAPVVTDVAWQVLTDFDHMAEWVPNVR